METMARKSGVGAFCCAMLLTSSTWAASLQPGQGSLTINQGDGFQPVGTRIDANVGDSVMVSPDGSATVTYDDGCAVNVQPGSVTTVAPISPCASGSYAADDNNLLLAGGLALGAGTAIGVGIWSASTSGNTNGAAASP